MIRFLASIDPFEDDLFDVKGKFELEAVISSHCLSRNAVMGLYIEFVEADEVDPSLVTIATNVGTKAEVESSTIQLCDVTHFYEPKLVPTEQEPCGFDENGSDNTLDPDSGSKAYELSLHMTNIDLSANGGLVFR
ncbi:hypothetical protein J1N35_013560 [Gossypium stocksii]|uniref:Uncharacterized protein n=1 Tax=Gossypium stocksii TaxID=47602 RepID=A0A9D3VUA5_9ROSI|nr:hypothetical protein J1N35_013560 [Gossypium stocksii]